MRINILSLWICSSVLFQEALGGPPTSEALESTRPSSSVVSENLDWVLSSFEASLPTQESIKLRNSLQGILHQYDAQVEELKHTIETYDTTAREAIEVFDDLSSELTLCKDQDEGASPHQSKAFHDVSMDKREAQLYRSYLTLKPQFKDALKVLHTHFPGFKYDAKKFAGLADQFESWAKTGLPASPSKG